MKLLRCDGKPDHHTPVTWTATSPDARGKITQELMAVTVLPSARGRKPGGEYFDPASIKISWKTVPTQS